MFDSFTRGQPPAGHARGHILPLRAASRWRKCLAPYFLLLISALPIPGLAGALPEPFWSVEPAISTDDGHADLHWAVEGSDPVEFFRLTERFDGKSAVHFVDHPTTRLYRNEPGTYEFWVQACTRDSAGYPNCGSMSPRLELTVTEAVQDLQTGPAQGRTKPPGQVRSPSGFAPGRWHNPDREGHGWSFYWKSRLFHHPSHPEYGDAWDLLGVWYTYEARLKYAAVPGTCPGPNCTWIYDDYRPVYARMWLTKVNSHQYHGSVYITRSNIQTNVGSLSVTFGQNSSTAELLWGASFRWQNLTGSDDIELLVAPDANPIDNPAHYSGLWALPPDEEYLVAHALGWTSESVEVMFEDEDGQPAWIMATGDDPVAGNTELCFFYVAQGFPPGTTGNMQFYEQGCDADLPANAGNRNGSRRFTNFEREDFWVSFHLPGGSAPDGFFAGTANFPHRLHKHASFHRIEYDSPSGISCHLEAGSPECRVSLTWFSDGNFPETSAFANKADGEPLLVASEGVTQNFEWCIDEPGQWKFELRMGDTPDSSLMGISDPFTVTGTATSACGGVGGGGTGSGSPEEPPPPALPPDMTPTLASSRTGATVGEFAVSATGAASYRIPILAAPGSGGLAPSVALVYDSQSGNGPVGVGWGIDGFSVISRCAQTIEQDGASRPGRISFSDQDRFCLDGERLMAVNGAYGAHGTEYRKERDDFTRVISYGAGGDGPQYFKAWSREGIAFEFGRTADSRIETRAEGIGDVAFAWAQNRVEDTAGNYVVYEYSEQALGPVDFVLDKIRYTGNTGSGTQPFAEIRFIYSGGRPDSQTAYIAGVGASHSRLLQRIDSLSRTAAGAPLQSLRSYRLGYGVDGWGRAVLESVTECRDSSASVCFEPSSFDWLKSEHAVTGSGPDVSSLFTVDFRGLALGDTNGDGRSDLLITERDGVNFEFGVATGSASGNFTLGAERFELPHGEKAEEPVALTVIDLNADGYQDVLYTRKISNVFRWYARLAGRSGMGNEFVVLDNCCGTLSPPLLQVMDFDGDGLSDIMTSRPLPIFEEASEIVVLINDFQPGDALPSFRPPLAIDVNYPELFPTFTETGWELADEAPIFGFQTGRYMPGRVDDFHGDGSVDILVRLSRFYRKCRGGPCTPNSHAGTAAPSHSVFIIGGADEPLRAQPGIFPPGTEFAYATFYLVFFADENGDFSTYELIAKGAGEDCDVPDICNPQFLLPEIKRAQPVDLNADGLADVAYLDDDFDWHYRLNTGGGFLPPRLIGQPPNDERAELARLIDITGDGYPEFTYPSLLGSDNSVWMVQDNDLGNGFSVPRWSTMPVGNTHQGDASIMLDFTGDGIVDQLFIDWRADGNGAQGGTTRVWRGINSLTAKSGEPSNLVEAFEDGFGRRTHVDYAPLTDPDVHSRMNDSAAATWGLGSAVYDLAVPFYVVSSVANSAPVFGNPTNTARQLYHYVGAKLQAGGRGFLGFAEMIEYDVQNALRTNTRYRQDFPFTGLVADVNLFHTNYIHRFDLITDISMNEPPVWPSIVATTPILHDAEGILLRNSIHEWYAAAIEPGSGVWAIRSPAELSRDFSLEGQFKRKILTTRSMDGFGNILTAEVRRYASDGAVVWSRITTENEWSNDEARWRLGRLDATEVTHWRADAGPMIVRRSSFSYHPVSSLLVRETDEPGHPTRQVVTNHTLDSFGNRIHTAVAGIGMSPRGDSANFDGWGRFTIESRNAYNQVTHRVLGWDPFGNPLQTQNIDGVVSLTAADQMGRLFAHYSATGAWTRSDFGEGGHIQCPSGTAFHSIAMGGGQPQSIECFDPLGRTIRKAVEGFLGGWINVDSYFDVSGRPQRVSEPHFSGQVRHWNLTQYDSLSRIIETTAANGLVEQVVYDSQGTHCGHSGVRGMLTRTIPGDGTTRQSWEMQNVAGQTERVIDEGCADVAYGYDAVGNLVEVENIDGSVIAIGYDALGMYKVQMNDPDKGYWQYASNALGEVTRQLDSKQQAIDFQYDLMGRVVNRRELTGVSSLNDNSFQTRNHEIRVWQNSSSPGVTGRGQLVTERYVQGEAGAVLHERAYSHDAFGRNDRVDQELEGRTFIESTTYDQFGRVFQRFDASGNSHGARYHYNPRGYLHKIQEARQGEDAVVYQEVLAVDQRGNPTAAVLGNQTEVFADFDPASGFVQTLEAYSAGGGEMQRVEYSFDRLGNLESRHDRSGSSNMREDFDYDELSRLERVMLTAPAFGLNQFQTQSLSYDASGNITYKSGVGSYLYGAGTAGPHAVTRAGSVSYSYDANGNQVGSSDGRFIDYAVFDKPVRIEKGGDFTEFAYGLANQRYKRVDSNDVDQQKTTWTIGGVEFIEKASSVFFKRYIAGVAIVDYYPSNDASEEWYLAKDHLGSVHTISDAEGNKVHENHFDPWGIRQKSNWQTPLTIAAATTANAFTTRGFTGHEHADGLGIIHMNGRIYDPRLGRFLQADPFVQTPRNGQSLNRYTYALNNPLSYTDPSGYLFKRLIRKWGRVIVAAIASYFTFGAAYGVAASAIASGVSQSLAFAQFIGTVGWQVVAGVAAGAASGLVAGAILTGSLRGAVKSAFVGAITFGVNRYFGHQYSLQRVAAESVAGGVNARILGGEFENGLRFALIVSGLNYANYRMRTSELELSSQHPAGRNTDGISMGAYGDQKKLGGSRELLTADGVRLSCRSIAGGCQGAPLPNSLDQRSNLFGRFYPPGGLADYFVEKFSGPHDWLRNHVSRSYYTETKGFEIAGNVRVLTGIRRHIDQIANFALIPVAAPFALAGILATQPPLLVVNWQHNYGE